MFIAQKNQPVICGSKTLCNFIGIIRRTVIAKNKLPV